MAKTRKSGSPKPQPHSAVTGRFVTKKYAESHPKTTAYVTPKKH
ncbi:hypothetical protein [Bifidobacterium cuniculi]|uniref:Uncharacterized protein n=1 Tax=Bifidobacterium cuniculi TaxID=1688 RepID=A0A087B3Z1_9BIFI|nr:hypothetical protein [Bifidobacterium cuniculi]KFI65741.1 hypothetical protein BCUN_0236 [Bifidobacterium cuniculi]